MLRVQLCAIENTLFYLLSLLSLNLCLWHGWENSHVFCTVTKGFHVWGGINHAVIANFVLYNIVMSLQNTFYTLSCMCILLSELCYVILHWSVVSHQYVEINIWRWDNVTFVLCVCASWRKETIPTSAGPWSEIAIRVNLRSVFVQTGLVLKWLFWISFSAPIVSGYTGWAECHKWIHVFKLQELVRHDYPYYYDKFNDLILRIPGTKFCHLVVHVYLQTSNLASFTANIVTTFWVWCQRRLRWRRMLPRKRGSQKSPFRLG